MGAFIVYLIVFAFVALVLLKFFQNIKAVLAIGLALICAYYLVNYKLKDADLSDENVKQTVQKYNKKVDDAIDTWEGNMDRYSENIAKDNFMHDSIFINRNKARDEANRKQDEYNIQRAKEKHDYYVQARDRINRHRQLADY